MHKVGPILKKKVKHISFFFYNPDVINNDRILCTGTRLYTLQILSLFQLQQVYLVFFKISARLKNLSATCYSAQRNESHQVVPLEIKMSL